MPKKARRYEMDGDTGVVLSKIPTFFVAAYVRLSVDNHDRKTESIENQKELIDNYIRKNNENPNRDGIFSLQYVYEDKGLSGTDFDRQGFEEMMDSIREGKVNCVIVKDLSRFGRDYLDACNLLEHVLPFMNVRFISISEGYDSFAEDADLKKQQVRLHNLLNELYAKDISLKISREKKASQQKGSFIGSKAAYGYRAEWHSGIRILVADEEPAQIVRQIFEWYDRGDSCNEIADRLYEMKIHRPNDYIKYQHVYQEAREPLYHWKRETLKGILRNVVYVGDLAQGKREQMLYDGMKESRKIEKSDWVIKRDAHEPLVSREVFKKAEERVEQEINKNNIKGALNRGKKNRENAVYENVFADVMFCGDCGKKLHASYYQGRVKDIRNYRYYCDAQYYKDCRRCKKKFITEGKLLEVFRSVVRNELTSSGLRGKDLTEKNNRVAKQAIGSLRSDKAKCECEKNKWNNRLRDTFLAYKHGELSLEEYQAFRQTAADETGKLEMQISKIDKELVHLNRKREKQNTFLRGLLKVDASGKIDKQLVDSVVESIYLYENEAVAINLKFKGDEIYAVK